MAHLIGLEVNVLVSISESLSLSYSLQLTFIFFAGGAWIVPSIQFASGKIDQPPMAPIESISMGAPPLWPLPPLQTLSLVTPIDASAEDGASAEVDSDSQNRSTNQEKL